MDGLILEGVLRNLERALTGRTLLAWDRLSEWEYLLRFATAAGDNLKVSLRLPFPSLYRLPHRDTPKAADPDFFSGIAARELEGTVLREIARLGCDRVVSMSWERMDGEKRGLVAELLGKSANLILLDSQEKVIAFAREMDSAFRAPEAGKPYQPPVARPHLEGAPLDPARLDGWLARFPPETAGEASAEFFKFLSPPLAADLAQTAEEEPARALKRVLAAAREGRLEPVLYTDEPLADMLEHPDRSPHPPLLSPLPLARPPLPAAASFADCEEAARVATQLMEARQITRELRERLAGALGRETLRLEKLAGKLQREREDALRWEVHQRWGDLILAAPDATVQGDAIRVPDLYSAGQQETSIPADPSLSARENAEKHYARARKLRRGIGKIEERLEQVSSLRASRQDWRRRLEAATGLAALAGIEQEMIRAGILHRHKDKPEARREELRAGDPGIRKYRTADGFIILVGRTSRDNDRLTFRVASPHDFWFHAADRSGAHVVVRNPSRLKELPKGVALAAARLAAHFSRAKGKGKAEVHHTLRKHVRKGKGFAPGMVTIRNYQTLEVVPGIPEGEKEEG